MRLEIVVPAAFHSTLQPITENLKVVKPRYGSIMIRVFPIQTRVFYNPVSTGSRWQGLGLERQGWGLGRDRLLGSDVQGRYGSDWSNTATEKGPQLVGALEHESYFSIYLEYFRMIFPTDFHIFQRG